MHVPFLAGVEPVNQRFSNVLVVEIPSFKTQISSRLLQRIFLTQTNRAHSLSRMQPRMSVYLDNPHLALQTLGTFNRQTSLGSQGHPPTATTFKLPRRSDELSV